MLSSLIIKNILLIDLVELEFKKGLNTLTGETGAGKSILLDCLGFVLGWNNSSDLVREGAEVGEVIAEFTITNNHEVSSVLEESGISLSDNIIIRRMINTVENRKRNFINDKTVSLDLIRRISKHLVELQGQAGNQILLSEQCHIDILDNFAGLSSRILELQKLWKESQRAKKNLESEIIEYDSAKLDKEYLEFSITEIQNFNVNLDEEEQLDLKRRQVRGIEKNREKFEKIDKLMLLTETENNISDVIKLLDLTRESVGDVVDLSIAALDQTITDFLYARTEIKKLLDSQDFDTNDLESIEDRLFKLRALGRKYNVTTNELPQLHDDMVIKLENLNSAENNIMLLQEYEEQAIKSYLTQAKIVSEERFVAAENLDRIVMAELKYLKMPDCIFKTAITSAQSGPRGIDNVVFKAVTNRGGKFDRLQAIASGGEISRFLLALKVCLTNQEQGTTIIFDEIDRGIGGATADSVGYRLSMLAKKSQIIIVTHSPQVAAHGDHQWKVEKLQPQDSLPITRITELNNSDRLTEIARMLAGKEISIEALAAARKLLG